MRNSNAFVGNLCTINLPCSVSMTQISLISKRHSLNTACMDALTHLCKGPTSGPQTHRVKTPPYPPKHSLLRDSPQVMSLTKKPTSIFVFSQSHTWDLLHFYSSPWDDSRLQTFSCPPVWRSYTCSNVSEPSVWQLSSHSHWPKSSNAALLKMKRCSLELIRHRQGSYWFYSTSCW